MCCLVCSSVPLVCEVFWACVYETSLINDLLGCIYNHFVVQYILLCLVRLHDLILSWSF